MNPPRKAWCKFWIALDGTPKSSQLVGWCAYMFCTIEYLGYAERWYLRFEFHEAIYMRNSEGRQILYHSRKGSWFYSICPPGCWLAMETSMSTTCRLLGVRRVCFNALQQPPSVAVLRMPLFWRFPMLLRARWVHWTKIWKVASEAVKGRTVCSVLIAFLGCVNGGSLDLVGDDWLIKFNGSIQ